MPIAPDSITSNACRIERICESWSSILNLEISEIFQFDHCVRVITIRISLEYIYFTHFLFERSLIEILLDDFIKTFSKNDAAVYVLRQMAVTRVSFPSRSNFRTWAVANIIQNIPFNEVEYDRRISPLTLLPSYARPRFLPFHPRVSLKIFLTFMRTNGIVHMNPA